ncbi:hypothetical protein PDESU_04552 [Pontiella desulfatans]|uniref:Uncharacterized protein n=1 Tax=Pontiella desulfatans TaxID=2750659 RepID=A0A6C2U815_PONDE|nr:hypothetical protein [Pontiella desulfatans]VGO15963.1 hypothetical protein PDESU_04552 [Pontiella desulfatans]
MQRTVQILLLVALLLPMAGLAREETLEERKTRITRKYLRKRVNISQSDMIVPSDLPQEDERVAASEKYKQADDLLQQQQQPSTLPPPQVRRPMPEEKESNWLLDDAAEELSDPYADPFAIGKPNDSTSDYWALFGGRSKDSSSSSSSSRRGEDSRYDPYASRSLDRYGSGTDGRVNQGFDSYGRPLQGSRYGQSTQSGLYGQRQDSSVSDGTLGSRRSYGSSPDSGLLLDSFPRTQSSGSDAYRRYDSGSRETRGYTPTYQSPLQTRREQQRQQGAQDYQKKEYQQPNTYQQWKDRSKAWDPTKDDAYVDELMRKNRK